MAVAGIQLSAEITDLRELQATLGRLFTPQEKTAILKAALEKAIEPLYLKLQQTVRDGPTGNLRRAIAKKIVPYTQDGNAVAVVGFRRAGRQRSESAAGGRVRAGRDRAFHQWWLEEGTRERHVNTLSNTPYIRKAHQRRMKSGTVAQVSEHTVKGQGGYIASSYNRLGPFRMVKDPANPGRVVTNPPYQRAFFRKSKTPIVIPAMNPGGLGDPPLKTAWAQTQGAVAEILQRELRVSLERALASISSRSVGTIE